jgi:ribonuclease G
MSKEIYISSTPHETRLAIVENDELAEIYYERENEYTLAGSIYNGRVTRVLPGMQSSFVEIGLERDAFLYITDFMEEAGDSADFEVTHGGGGEARAPRTDRGDRNGRSERGDRGERPAPVVLEGNIEASSERAQEGRSDRDPNSRGDRNGRGRNRRGRGDRNGRPDRAPVAEATESPRTFEAPIPIPPVVSSEAGELGEGAPGADGSRRWRGRRGRRRGRSGAGQPGEASREAVTPSPIGENEFADYSVEVDSTPEPEFRAPAAATAPILNAYPEPYADEDEPARSAPPRDGQGRNDRGGRNGRNDRNDRGGRGGRSDRPDRGDRAPRGFAPSTSLYGVDSSDSAEAPAEPIILPGESLSKYRRGSESEANQTSAPAASLPPNVILAKPANIIDDTFIATAWDGGSVLPGETLSRRSRPESRQDSRREEGRGPRRDFNNQQSASHRSEAPKSNFVAPVPEQPTVVADHEGISVVSAPEQQPEVAQAAHLDQVPEHEIQHETPSPFTADVPSPLDPIAAVPEPSALEAEYEPTEASASFRVDPAAPSEFRQSAPVLEEEILEEDLEEDVLSEDISEAPHVAAAEPEHHEASVHVDHSHPFNRLDEADAEIEPHAVASEPVIEPTHEAPAFTEPIAYHQPEPHLDTTGVPPPPPPSFAHAAPVAEPADINSISAAGEMHSDYIAPAEEAVVHPASPMQHESSIATPQHFSPGSGQLEEEVMDEEEHEGTSLHAYHEEEFDDLEEETLEGAADLGTMIREMSIDQITRTGDVEAEADEEDEDFEEEESASSGEYETEEFEESEEGFVEGDKPTEQSAADAEFFANTFREPSTESNGDAAPRSDQDRRPRREGGRRDGRRDGRDRDRNRPRSTGGESDRSRSGHGGQRRSMQATNLPAISDLLKPGQEILVQIAKEPIAKKGARITSHIALPGRFLVFMPTVSHTGVSRKIESDAERRRLKEILLSEKGDAAGGFIVRTAASGASEDELRSDLRFLLNLWADIKQRSESSKSPALIYHDLNLVERILRDQVTDNFSAIWVDTESEYERVLRFLQRFQPQLIRRVKLYTKETPLFEQFGITEEINKALRSKVWLKSGGSIVINQTEALVAIDINTGKFVGKTARLEDTIVKTNLDAIPEIVRQIRLRDLGGIIIIDFIDMDERKNRNKVMAALEEELKSDRAPSKVLQFNDFGLVAITRKRVKQSLERTLSTTCGVCQGTGMVKSPITVCNDIYIEMRKMHKHLERGDVMLRVHPEVVKQLKSGTSKWLQEMEEMVGKTILVKSDPSLHPEQFDIH